MANKSNSLAHTKWMCKYHIVFTPKYRRKIIYNQYKESIRDILKQLCAYKGVEERDNRLFIITKWSKDTMYWLRDMAERRKEAHSVYLCGVPAEWRNVKE
jgi:hypothetical protein